MSATLLEHTESTLTKALKRFAVEADKNNPKPSNVYVNISLSDIDVPEPRIIDDIPYPIKRQRGQPFYRIFIMNDEGGINPIRRSKKIKDVLNPVETNEITFNELAGQLVDFFQAEKTGTPYLQGVLIREAERMTKEHQAQPGFQEYLKKEIERVAAAGGSQAEQDEAKQNLLDENTVWPTDLEIMVTTAQDEPIVPIPLLYYKGDQLKQLSLKKDVFQIIE